MHLTQELSRATRLGSQLALLIVDIDDFKRINDTAGHHIGDRVLREVGRLLRANVRAYDVCARYAGDEFLVMLPECGVERRRGSAGRPGTARWAGSSSKPGERQAAGRAPASVPRCSPSDGGSFEALLAAADRRMYRNKARDSRLHVLARRPRRRRASPSGT